MFLALAGYGDFEDTVDKIGDVPVRYLFGGLGLALTNYFLRYLRWCYYLSVLKIYPPKTLNLLVFLSGFAVSVTPGKAGELLKCYLLRSRMGVPVNRSAPVVVMERLVDVISVIILAFTGLAMLSVPVVATLSVVVVLVLVVYMFMLSRHVLRLARLPFLTRWIEMLQDSQDGFKQLAAAKVMFTGVSIGVLAWSAEGLALWVILQGVGADIELLKALSIYAAATLVGAATILPGGLIGTEGSMLALLQQLDVVKSAASASTVLVRLVTLWFAVAIGLLALVALRRIPGHDMTVHNGL